jgi:hypothetical protein
MTTNTTPTRPETCTCGHSVSIHNPLTGHCLARPVSGLPGETRRCRCQKIRRPIPTACEFEIEVPDLVPGYDEPPTSIRCERPADRRLTIVDHVDDGYTRSLGEDPPGETEHLFCAEHAAVVYGEGLGDPTYDVAAYRSLDRRDVDPADDEPVDDSAALSEDEAWLVDFVEPPTCSICDGVHGALCPIESPDPLYYEDEYRAGR